MLRCLQLAKLGQDKTLSNPMVGALLVHDNKIIGEGYHEKFGEAHAEVNCLHSVLDQHKEKIQYATLYVSLEPCNHFGKTPPCTQAIVDVKIPRVVIGTADNNPLVENKGIRFLKEKNIEVVTGICEKECWRLNKVFFTNHKYNRPFVKLKWAQDAKGFMGIKNQQIPISSLATNVISHKHRTKVDGILVGYQTALIDQPALSARHWTGKQAARIFMDWHLNLAENIVSKKGRRNIVLSLLPKESTHTVEYIQVEKSIASILATLYKNKIQSLLVEGGAKTLQSFIEADLWDEAIVIKSNQSIDGTIHAPHLKKGKLLNESKIETDTIYHYSHSQFIV